MQMVRVGRHTERAGEQWANRRRPHDCCYYDEGPRSLLLHRGREVTPPTSSQARQRHIEEF